MQTSNRRLTEEYFFAERQKVLGLWPTAREIDLDEAIQYRKGLPGNKKWVEVFAEAKKLGRIPVGAMIGKASLEETIADARALEESGADFLWLLPDTYSRRARYAEAEKALTESYRQGKSLLNGFPVVNHGLKRVREIREAVGVPVLLIDGSSERCMLLTETGLAAGFEHASYDVESVLRTSRDYPLEQKIREGQYQNRLAARYTENGSPVQTYIHNALCGLDPPEIKVALGVLHSLLVAEQGVKHITQETSLCCSLVQDVAALRAAKELTEEYLARSGYKVGVSLTCFPFAGLWPRNRDDAAGVCAWNTVIAVLAGTDWIPVKSLDEAHNIPGKEANIAAVRLAKRIVNGTRNQRLYSDDLALEKALIRLGAEAIVQKTLEMGNGDPVSGQVAAVESGVIDVAFSPYRKVRGAVSYLRDSGGAVRYFRHGNIPLPPEVVQYHREKIAVRQRAARGKTETEMMVEDIYHVAGKPG